MKVLIASGGTGGTVIPGIGIAQAVKKMEPQTQFLFVGTARGFETRLVPQAGFPLELLNIRGLKGKGIREKWRNLWILPKAFGSTLALLRRFRPDVVLGTGGFVTGPVLLMASLLRYRTLAYAPDALPGVAIRWVSRFVDRILLAFEKGRDYLPKKKCLFTGALVREEILNIAPPTFDGKKRTLLIYGGSQGAQTLNEAICEALPLWVALRNDLLFIHQTGEKDFEKVKAAYQKFCFIADVRVYFDDMADAYRRSDFILSRSGGSILEFASCGRPSILVPYPYAADDHQRVNAKVFEAHGAALILSDKECTGEKLAKTISTLLSDITLLRRMSAQALTFRQPEASSRIAREVLQGT